MKFSQVVILLVITLAGLLMIAGEVSRTNGGNPPREGLVRSIMRATAHWFVDRTLKTEPPTDAQSEPERKMELGPISTPPEFLAMPGKPLDHGEGW